MTYEFDNYALVDHRQGVNNHESKDYCYENYVLGQLGTILDQNTADKVFNANNMMNPDEFLIGLYFTKEPTNSNFILFFALS